LESEILLNRLDEVICTDARYVSRENFLVTHTPFQQLTLKSSGMVDRVLDEEAVLQEVLLQSVNKHKFIVVQGDQGTGKSHVIRWLMERYLHHASQNGDVILFITRDQNTLRGALEQIIQSEVFPESYRDQELKGLVQANQHLSEAMLKRKIILSFAAISQEYAEKELESRYARSLYSFLVDETIQEFMCRSDGPIDRIQKRLNYEGSNQRTDDIEPRFFDEDLKLDYQQHLMPMQEGRRSGREALRLAEELADQHKGPALRTLLVTFLNKHRSEVIEDCTNLRAGDLKAIFERLRRDLKKIGKQFMLFVEDITSFTGIDRALMEVLIQEHTGGGNNEQLCRLCSIVGVTNSYYNHDLPENIQERVTSRIIIDQRSYDDEYVLEMTARYLNAVYLPKIDILNWAESGADCRSLPVAVLFDEHQWAKYQLSDGQELTIFPFNSNAVINACNTLKFKTPRHILQDVISLITRAYLSVAQTGPFPPPVAQFEGELTVPPWVTPTHEVVVINQGHQFAANITCLLRLWGNKTATREDSNTPTVGGLTKDVFEAFGLKFIEGVKAGSILRDLSTPSSHTLDSNSIVNTQGAQSESRTEGNTNSNFFRIQKQLDNWASGQSLSEYQRVRDDIYDALVDFIDWESEGVPGILLGDFSKQRFAIQGQTGRHNEGFIVKRDKSAQFALQAVAAWRYMGGCTWDFSESDDYIAQLYLWLTSVKDDFIQAIRQPAGLACPWQGGAWSIIGDYYGLIIGGKLPLKQSAYQLYNLFANKWSEVVVEEQRSVKWRELQRRQEKFANNHNFLLDYYNLKQGDVTQERSIYYLNANAILEEIEKWEALVWDVKNIPEDAFQNLGSTSWYISLQALHEIRKNYDIALADEQKAAENIAAKLTEYLGETAAASLFREMRDFLTLLRDSIEGYKDEDYTVLTSKNISGENLTTAVAHAKRLATSQGVSRNALVSTYPATTLQQVEFVFGKYEALLDEKLKKFNEKRAKRAAFEDGNSVENTINEAVILLSSLREALMGVGDETC